MVKLYHRKNEIAIDLSGIQNVAAIDISYTGRMYGESQLPSDWHFTANSKRVICFSLGDSVPELLFIYTGLINIRGASVIDRDLTVHPVAIFIEDIDYWENITGKFNQEGQTWGALGSTHKMQKGLYATSIVRNNLLTNFDEFFFADGTPYTGDYHQHQDSQAMTGAEHSEESELIYRKDANGNIFNARKRVTRRQVIKIMKQVKPFIPITRKITKSDTQKIKESQKIAHKQLKEEEIEKIYREDRTIAQSPLGGERTSGVYGGGGEGGGGEGG